MAALSLPDLTFPSRQPLLLRMDAQDLWVIRDAKPLPQSLLSRMSLVLKCYPGNFSASKEMLTCAHMQRRNHDASGVNDPGFPNTNTCRN
jgi:hypothetical protein